MTSGRGFFRLAAEYGVLLYISGHHHGFYPGRDPQSGLRMLGAGCLGGGPRPLLGEERTVEDLDDPRERNFVWLEVDATGIRSLEAYRGPDFSSVDRIERRNLPEAHRTRIDPVGARRPVDVSSSVGEAQEDSDVRAVALANTSTTLRSGIRFSASTWV